MILATYIADPADPADSIYIGHADSAESALVLAAICGFQAQSVTDNTDRTGAPAGTGIDHGDTAPRARVYLVHAC